MRAASDEPEWFAGGPSTTDEQIELRGMSDEEKENDASSNRPRRSKTSASTSASAAPASASASASALERKPVAPATIAEKDNKTPEQTQTPAQTLQQTGSDADDNEAEPECMPLPYTVLLQIKVRTIICSNEKKLALLNE